MSDYKIKDNHLSNMANKTAFVSKNELDNMNQDFKRFSNAGIKKSIRRKSTL